MKSLVFIIALVSSFASLASSESILVKENDTIKDVHHNINNFCQDPATDIASVEVEILESVLKVKMQMTKEIGKRPGYREYYFWVGATPSKSVGYRPYDPHSVAWPDFFATNRVFVSFNADVYSGREKNIVSVQDCLTSDCSNDQGLVRSEGVKYKVQGNVIEFEVARSTLPLIGSEDSVKFGFTTYYSFAQCEGEDDYPNWDEQSLKIDLTKSGL